MFHNSVIFTSYITIVIINDTIYFNYNIGCWLLAHLVVWQFQLENVLLRQSNMKKMSHSRQDTDKNLRLFPSYGHLRSCVTYQRKLMTTHHTPEYVLIWFKSLTWPKYNSCNGFSILNQCSSKIFRNIIWNVTGRLTHGINESIPNLVFLITFHDIILMLKNSLCLSKLVYAMIPIHNNWCKQLLNNHKYGAVQ